MHFYTVSKKWNKVYVAVHVELVITHAVMVGRAFTLSSLWYPLLEHAL